MGHAVRMAAGFFAALVLAVLLTACAPREGIDMTLDEARQEMYGVMDQMALVVPEAVVTARRDYGAIDRRLLKCGNDSFAYSDSMSLTVSDPSVEAEVLKALEEEWLANPDFAVRVLDQPGSKTVEVFGVGDGPYVAAAFNGNSFKVTGFSRCFSGDGYNLNDKY